MAYNEDDALRRAGDVARSTFDPGLRAYMVRVYSYMLAGLTLTGLTAKLASMAATVNTGHGPVVLTPLGRVLYNSPLTFVITLAPLAFIAVLVFGLERMRVATAQAVFWAYAVATGLSLSVMFLAYSGTGLAQAFFITAASFGALSLWGYTTRSDLSGLGSFMIMGLAGLLLTSLVNMVLHSDMADWVFSVAAVGIFAGLTAFDTQAIKETYDAGEDGPVAGKKAIMGAVTLYLDFLNIFLNLARLIADHR